MFYSFNLAVRLPQMPHNVLWYGVVRGYEAISYQFTPIVF